MSDVSPDSADGRSEADSASESAGVTPDDAFAALADPQRRVVLSYLHERPNETVTVETLAAVVSKNRCESDSTHRVAASLSGTHLPKLDDWNLIEYEREHRQVRYTDSPLVNELVRRLSETERG